MAKQQTNNNGSNGGKKGGNGAGSTKDRGRMIAESEGGRATKRNHRKSLDVRRNNERETGEFYLRTNEGRSADIAAACRGEVGNYAFPGGNAPSLHFNVQKEVGKQGSLSVIRLETVQRGHELEGEVFDQKVFLPSFYVEKFGGEFRSRFDDRLAASTQELICHYMADQLGFGTNFDEVEVAETTYEQTGTETFDSMFARASDDMKSMLNGIVGLYGLTTGEGQVILEVFTGKRSNLQVIDSTDPQVSAERVYIPVKCVFHNTLDKVTDDKTYGLQLAIYTFIRSELGQLILEIKKEREEARKALRSDLLEIHTAAIDAGREAVKLASAEPQGKAGKKQLKKMADKMRQQEAWAAQQRVIENMRRDAISLREAATGKQGWVVMTHTSGDLIVLYGMVGPDKIAQVVHLDRNHILRLAGVDVGTKVYVGQVRAGEIDRIDQVNHRLTAEQVKAGNALITHLRDQLEANGIKLIAPSRNLRLVKSA